MVQAVIAAVELGRLDVGQLAELAVELGLGQGGVEREEGFEHLRVVGHGPEDVGHGADLLLHALEDRLDLLARFLVRDVADESPWRVLPVGCLGRRLTDAAEPRSRTGSW